MRTYTQETEREQLCKLNFDFIPSKEPMSVSVLMEDNRGFPDVLVRV